MRLIINYVRFCFCKHDWELMDKSVKVNRWDENIGRSIPPKISISNFMGYLKGKSTLMIYDRHPEQQSKWNKAFWARGYYVATVGNVTEDAIKKYIREQSEESQKEDSEGAAF